MIVEYEGHAGHVGHINVGSGSHGVVDFSWWRISITQDRQSIMARVHWTQEIG